ncbi:hypothetical protein BHK98_04500 [Hornefia porci]|uniref:Uncharacterized protein n=1 Tax=Hornefia porci TaxID=2652292 RepID=A0A1Q9JGR3_9FIRM|nr:DUF5688 family protein [Hornefia porci]OLR55392.1 hypothetical protein BHK98_04500 [Hornefia porci]
MNSTEFCREMMNKIPEFIPMDARAGLELSMQEVVKVNDQVLHGLVFRQETRNAAPTFYLDDAYRDHERGMSMDLIADNIAKAYMETKDMGPVSMERMPMEMPYESIREQITMRLVEVKRNRQFLQDRPCMNVGHGLAVALDIQISDENGAGLVSITNDLMEHNGYDRRELFENAMADAWRNAPPTLRDMQSSLFGIGGDNILDNTGSVASEDKAMMYVLSNSECRYGAAAMFYPGMQEKIAESLGEGYYALPSSLHEYLIILESFGLDPAELTKMVREANRNEGVVSPKDVLSDQVLHYDREAKHLDNVPMGRDKESRMETI